MAGGMEVDFLRSVGVSEEQIVIVPINPPVWRPTGGEVDHHYYDRSASLQTLLDNKNDPGIERVADFKQPIVDGKSVISYGLPFSVKEMMNSPAFNDELEKLKASGAAGNNQAFRIYGRKFARRHDCRRCNRRSVINVYRYFCMCIQPTCILKERMKKMLELLPALLRGWE